MGRGDDGAGSGWHLLILLTMINVLNFVDRQLLPSFANFIKPDLALTDTQFGLLTGLFFIIFYAVAGMFMGILADLVHRGRLIAGAIALWSLLTAASGAAKGFLSLALPRALVGVGESALTPSAMSLLAERFKPNRLGLAVGIYYLGVPIGSGLSLIIAGVLGPQIGWRNCFYILGALGLIFAFAMLFVRDDRVKVAREARPGFRVQFRQLVAALRKAPSLVAIMIGGVSIHFAVGAAAFDQLWFVQERGFDKAEIAKISGVLIAVGGIAGNLFGGFAGDWWQERTGSGRPMLLFWMLIILSPFAILYRLAPPDSPLLLIGIVVGIFQLAAFYGPTFSCVQELTPGNARGTVTAFYILCLNVIGLGVGITVTGWLVDLLRAGGSATPYSDGLLAMTYASFLSIPAFFFAGRWFKRDRDRVTS